MPALDLAPAPDLPAPLAQWFAAQGWAPHAHQIQMLQAGGNRLLIAPTGGGKTLAGFLPTLAQACADALPSGLHTLYVSPLKALTHDIARNLARPVAELRLNLRIEDRTGDTAAALRARQRVDPPHILLTTPESLALMLSYPEAPRIFAGLRRVVVDEIHALAESKRGDHLMLGLARLHSLAPGLQVVGLSATVESSQRLARFMGGAEIVLADPGPAPDISMLPTRAPPPWSGAGGAYAARDVMAAIEAARLTLVFINTRAQAELFFQALWAVNERNLPIGLHHGSLAREARRKVESAMAEGQLRAVVATGSLDLGLDWGDVDLVLQIGAPKNIKRLVQRIGRANHRYDMPSRARIVPANRFEVLECVAALQAVAAGELDGADDMDGGALDVLCQHLLCLACAGPLEADALFEAITRSGPYAALQRAEFDACLDFVATGGYALRAYDRWQRLVLRDGRWQLRDPRAARDIRMNIGTIVAPELLSVRRGPRGGAPLGEIEESFAASLRPGDTFLIGGQTVRYDRLRDMVVEVTPQPARMPKIAVFNGLKMATSTELSARVLALIGDRSAWAALPKECRDWLDLQGRIAHLPRSGTMTSDSFERGGRWYFALYSFAGRNANQTMGLLVTHRMEGAGLAPLGFVATDYALLIWSLEPVRDPAPLLDPQELRIGLQDWLAENAVMKRSFRAVATVAGLIQRNLPGQRKSGKQATFSSDILYDTLRKYDPDHLLLRITRREAQRGLADFGRIEEMLRARGKIVHAMAPHVTPLAAPLLLEAGRIPIRASGAERVLEEEAARMMAEAGLTLEATEAKSGA
ncbi:MAG: ligase-associated DNA damage response DEXH box helicase [Roseinatronobacter sp.]|nr:ligase-associated DNA damage response DEXH box helicase [Roseinatronobacter sp.]